MLMRLYKINIGMCWCMCMYVCIDDTDYYAILYSYYHYYHYYHYLLLSFIHTHRQINTMSTQMGTKDKLATDYSHMKRSNDELKTDLKESVEKNVLLSNQLHTLTAQLHEANNIEAEIKKNLLR